MLEHVEGNKESERREQQTQALFADAAAQEYKPTSSLDKPDNQVILSTPETVKAPRVADTERVSTTDEELLKQANEHVRQERLLQAARVLRKVKNKQLLQAEHYAILKKAIKFEAAAADLTSSPNGEWTKQGESHGHRDVIIYYKVQEPSRLTARIECPIEQSLLVPLLSVFNESELYATWMPSFHYPVKLGVSRSVKLRQSGRSNQIIAVTTDMPWPVSKREAIIEATAVDDIDDNGHILVKMETRYQGEENGLIPPPDKGVLRIEFDGAILFRKCPNDHPALLKSKHQHHEGDLILVGLTMFVDGHVKYVPQKLINFVTRTVLGRMWAKLLHVAEDVRDGKRPQHAQAIAAKRELLYDWVEGRIQVMLDGIGEEH